MKKKLSDSRYGLVDLLVGVVRR